MALDQNEIILIKELLHTNTHGMSIKDISDILKINRNVVAKFLDILHFQGQVELRKAGPSHLYFPTSRIPILSICKFCTLPLLLINDSYEIVDVNGAFSHRFNLNKDTLIGRSLDDIPLHFFEGSDTLHILTLALSGVEKQYPVQLQDDTRVLKGMVHMVPVVFENGNPGVALLFEENVTAIKTRGEDDTPGSIDKISHDDGFQFVVHCAPDGTTQYVNDVYCQAVGKKRDDLIGKRFTPQIIDDDLELYNSHRDRISPSHPVDTIVYRVFSDNGDIQWHRWKTRICLDEQGRVIGTIAFGIDITDLKTPKKAIENYRKVSQNRIESHTSDLRGITEQLNKELSNQYLLELQVFRAQFIADNTSEIFIMVDEEAHISYINRQAENTTGYSPGDCPHLTIDIVLPDYPLGKWQIFLKKLKRNDSLIHETTITSRSGKITPVEISFRSLVYQGKEYVCCFGRTISDRKPAGKELVFKNSLLSILLENSTRGIRVVNRNRKIVYINNQYLDILNIPPDTIAPGSDEYDLLTIMNREVDCAGFLPGIEMVYSNNNMQTGEEITLKDGRILEWYTTPITGSDNSYYGQVWYLQDITRSKKEREDVKYKNILLSTILETTHDGILIVNESRTNLKYNPRFADIWDLPPDIPDTCSHKQLLSSLIKKPKDPTTFLSRVEEMYAHPQEKLFERPLAFKDGTVLACNSVPMWGTDGIYQGRVWICRDISEYKRNEEDLKLKTALILAIQEAIPDGILVMDAMDTIITYNHRIMEIFSGTPSGFIEQGMYTEALMAFIDEMVEPAGFLTRLEYLYAHPEEKSYDEIVFKDGRVLKRYSASIKGSDGIYSGRVWIYNDISAQKQRDCELTQLKHCMEALINFLPDAMFAINQKGEVTAWNNAMELLTGVTSENILGKGDYEYSLPFYGIRRPMLVDLVLYKDQIFAEKYLFLEKDGERYTAESLFYKVSGKKIHLHGTASPVYDENGRVIGAIESIRELSKQIS